MDFAAGGEQQLGTGDGYGLYQAELLRARVREAVAHWTAVSNAFAKERGKAEVPLLPVSFNIRGRCAGQYRFERKATGNVGLEYRINEDLLRRYPVEMIQQTVPHEVAHAATRVWAPKASPHGKEWQYVMRSIFKKEPTLYHKMDTGRRLQAQRNANSRGRLIQSDAGRVLEI